MDYTGFSIEQGIAFEAVFRDWAKDFGSSPLDILAEPHVRTVFFERLKTETGKDLETAPNIQTLFVNGLRTLADGRRNPEMLTDMSNAEDRDRLKARIESELYRSLVGSGELALLLERYIKALDEGRKAGSRSPEWEIERIFNKILPGIHPSMMKDAGNAVLARIQTAFRLRFEAFGGRNEGGNIIVPFTGIAYISSREKNTPYRYAVWVSLDEYGIPKAHFQPQRYLVNGDLDETDETLVFGLNEDVQLEGVKRGGGVDRIYRPSTSITSYRVNDEYLGSENSRSHLKLMVTRNPRGRNFELFITDNKSMWGTEVLADEPMAFDEEVVARNLGALRALRSAGISAVYMDLNGRIAKDLDAVDSPVRVDGFWREDGSFKGRVVKSPWLNSPILAKKGAEFVLGGNFAETLRRLKMPEAVPSSPRRNYAFWSLGGNLSRAVTTLFLAGLITLVSAALPSQAEAYAGGLLPGPGVKASELTKESQDALSKALAASGLHAPLGEHIGNLETRMDTLRSMSDVLGLRHPSPALRLRGALGLLSGPFAALREGESVVKESASSVTARAINGRDEKDGVAGAVASIAAILDRTAGGKTVMVVAEKNLTASLPVLERAVNENPQGIRIAVVSDRKNADISVIANRFSGEEVQIRVMTQPPVKGRFDFERLLDVKENRDFFAGNTVILVRSALWNEIEKTLKELGQILDVQGKVAAVRVVELSQ